MMNNNLTHVVSGYQDYVNSVIENQQRKKERLENQQRKLILKKQLQKRNQDKKNKKNGRKIKMRSK